MNEGTHGLFVRIAIVGVLLVVAATLTATFARSRKRFIVLMSASFGLSGALRDLVEESNPPLPREPRHGRGEPLHEDGSRRSR